MHTELLAELDKRKAIVTAKTCKMAFDPVTVQLNGANSHCVSPKKESINANFVGYK